MAYVNKYSGYKYKYKYFKLVLEYNSSISTSTKYHEFDDKPLGVLCSSSSEQR